MKKTLLPVIMTLALLGCTSSSAASSAAASASPSPSASSDAEWLACDETIPYGLEIDHSKPTSGIFIRKTSTYSFSRSETKVDTLISQVDDYFYYKNGNLSAARGVLVGTDGEKPEEFEETGVLDDGSIEVVRSNVVFYNENYFDQEIMITSKEDSSRVEELQGETWYSRRTYSKDGVLADICDGPMAEDQKGECVAGVNKLADNGLYLVHVEEYDPYSTARMIRFEYYPNQLIYREIAFRPDSPNYEVTVYEYGTEEEADDSYRQKFPNSGILTVVSDKIDAMSAPSLQSAKREINRHKEIFEVFAGEAWACFDTKEADGLTWYQLGADCWIPAVPGQDATYKSTFEE